MKKRARAIALHSLMFLVAVALSLTPAMAQCQRNITADVVAFDQVYFWNRLGAVQPQGMIYALRRDVVPIAAGTTLAPGNVQLRPDKRPRPMVLRMNVGDCLTINFQNYLSPTVVDNEQARTRNASIRGLGLQLVDASSLAPNVGNNQAQMVTPGSTAVYKFYAEREGSHLLYSSGATTGGEGDGGQLNEGLFGAVNVQPANAEWYRSQVTADEMKYATIGQTPAGQPIINYNALYPATATGSGHVPGAPVLKMLNANNEIVYADLTALITGPNAGRFPTGTYKANASYPDRDQPFREFTIIYHDEAGAVQAFDQFDDPSMDSALHSVRDNFAINYGIAGVGAEVLSNRLGVGPAAGCTECKFEEFFLSSWSLGDPAMVVDIPANAPCKGAGVDATITTPCTPTPGFKATKAFYADDPSNVYHSYIGDHVKFRIIHGGSKEHHIHHQHAHQWLFSPDSDNSTYLDSQAIGPGANFTLEINYNGSGNRNQTVGDSIFHCHFYPHFAQGMWSLWRTHDVFEAGTQLDSNSRPAPGSRAYPDAEIATGTPIPGIVPVPTIAMPPVPEAQVSIVNGQVQISGTGNPGYPFFVPAVAGHRPPHPPLDTIDDGGLPRHVITGGTANEQHTRLDFNKTLVTATARQVPEDGTDVEKAAMNYHAIRFHHSFKPDGTAADYKLNGLPPQHGAPYADPCIDDNGNPTGTPRTYKAAVIQLDVKLNKAGWHSPQQRIETLWDDVQPTMNGTRAPEPFFFRANTGDCISFYHTILAPNVYQMDDYEVRTPTDVMGQHIHLVKFDVTASDGAGNGWNYEDGTFSPDEVIERIKAINAGGGLTDPTGVQVQLTAKPHPTFGTLGAQTTVQRWYADALLNNIGKDRTLRTVFTHDHYGPSTHQQVGLYAGLVVEPQGSTWRAPESGQTMGTRYDGGPTSWRADILTANTADSYREFLLEIADYQFAYPATTTTYPSPQTAIQPPWKVESDVHNLFMRPSTCKDGSALPCPEVISSSDPGTMVVNYRNEPIPLRIRDPLTNKQASGDAGDLSMVFRSGIQRADSAFNAQPNFYPVPADVQATDPYTPLLRAYQNDKVQVRMLVGAHEEGHNWTMNGTRWLAEASDPNSGYRNSQMMGISEHFEFQLPGSKDVVASPTDFLYRGGSTDDMWNGLWGLMRVYDGRAGLRPGLPTLPNNASGAAPTFTNFYNFNAASGCPSTAPARTFNVVATTAAQALPNGTLVYNPRPKFGPVGGVGLNDPTALLYVRAEDLDTTGKFKAGVPIEPLILRAAAGDCITVNLTNKLPATLSERDGWQSMPMIVDNFNVNDVATSTNVGMHPQLLQYYNWTGNNDGINVGGNLVATAKPGATVTYRWYAGRIDVNPDGSRTATPVEYGATNLLPADPIKQGSKGLFGALIIEPKGATWVEDATARAQATVTVGTTSFRDFVVMLQNDVNLRYSDGSAVPNVAENEDPEDSGHKAINYRTEPMWARRGYAPDTVLGMTRLMDFTTILSNAEVGGDPVTPVFTAKAGQPVRFRVLHAAGHQRNNVFTVDGHVWQRNPYVSNSTAIGNNALSEFTSAQMGVGPSSHFDAPLMNGAGGKFMVAGDYLYRTFQSFQFDGGLWGLLRVTP